MVSFFRRKKPQDPAPAPASNRFSAQELAAAFPQAPTSAGPTPATQGTTGDGGRRCRSEQNGCQADEENER